MEIPSLSDLWDNTIDGIGEFFSFEWIGDAWDSISDVFSNLGEFSAIGLIHAIVLGGLSFWALHKMEFVRNNPQYYFIFIGVAMVFGYLMGKKVWGND